MLKRLLFCLFVGLPIIVISQKLSSIEYAAYEADSNSNKQISGSIDLVKPYLDSSKYYLNIDPNKSKLFIKKGIGSYSETTPDSIKCEFIVQEMNINIYRGEFKKAEESLKHLGQSECLANYKKYKLIYHIKKAYLHRVESKYRKAIEEYENVLNIVEGTNYEEYLVKAYYGLGGTYHRLEDIEPACKYFTKAKTLIKETNNLDSAIIANVYLSSGALYQEYGLYNEGLKDVNRAESMQPKNPRVRMFVYKNKAIMYADLDSFKLSESYYKKMIVVSKGNPFMIADAKAGLAKLYINNLGFGDHEEALLTSSFNEFKKSGNVKSQADIAYLLSTQYLQAIDTVQAKVWIKIHANLVAALQIPKQNIKCKYLNLKLRNIESGNRSNEIDDIALYADSIQAILDNEKIKRSEIGSRIKNDISKPQHKTDFIYTAAFIGICIFLLFASVFFYYRNRYLNKSLVVESLGFDNNVNTDIDRKVIEKLKSEKQELQELHRIERQNKVILEKQNKELIFQKSELEGKNQNLKKDNIAIKDGQKTVGLKLEIKTKGKINFIPSQDLMYIHAEENGCRYFLKNNTSFWNDERLRGWEERLDPILFVRIHRSTLVQKEYISKISYDMLNLVDGTELKIGRKYKDNL